MRYNVRSASLTSLRWLALRQSIIHRGLTLVFSCLLIFSLGANPGERTATRIQSEQLTRGIPARAVQYLTGSQFAEYVSKMNSQEREEAILEEISKGNVPEFLRRLVPVKLQCELPNDQ